MKKKTNVEPGGEGEVEPRKKKTRSEPGGEAEVKPRRRGPQQNKTQITLRLDKELVDEAYKQMKEDNTRITDVIERGLHLALKERDHDMSLFTKQIRFVLANTTREQQILLRGLAIAMVEPLLDEKVLASPLSVEAKKLYDVVRWYLESRNKMPHANACLEYYSRYGKSAEEIARLGSL